jgi:transposase
MFIRRTSTRNTVTGDYYYTFRLVRSARVGGKVRQVTILNLGRHFLLEKDEWPTLCGRIEELLNKQAPLLTTAVSAAIETLAQRYAAQIVIRSPKEVEQATVSGRESTLAVSGSVVAEVDTESLELLRPRSIGVEHVGLHAMAELGLTQILQDVGLNGAQRAAAIGNIIGRMAAPGSERMTWKWLQHTSGLGELLDVDFEGINLERLYRASDLLLKHREAIEARLFENIQSLFSLETTVTLFDLTNTYFEGEATANPKASRGRSKEKRSDCPLVTLALVLDSSGFVRRSRMFDGNVSEAGTLENMLNGLSAPKGAMVIMDRGIATQANLEWLTEHGYRYLVCRRGGARQFDSAGALSITSKSGETIRVQKELSEDGKTVHLYCHSAGREHKEAAINERFCSQFEAGLTRLQEGLTKPGGEKRLGKLTERIGRLKEKSRGASQHYEISFETANTADGSNCETVSSLTWNKIPVEGTSLTHPGVYCLSSNEVNWSEETLWQTYMTLTDLEAVFRSLKSELGLRPIYHHKEHRVDGHLFITVLAYQCVQTIRTKLKKHGITECWNSLRNTLSIPRRITVSYLQKDHRTLNVRKCTTEEQATSAIYQALGINSNPGGTKKLIL